MNQAALVVLVAALVALLVVAALAVGLWIVRGDLPWEVIRRRGGDNLLLAALFVPASGASVGASWLALTRIGQLSSDDALWISMALMSSIGVAVGAWHQGRSSARAGPVLIDLGVMRPQWSLVLTAIWLPCAFVLYPQAPATKLFCLALGGLPASLAMLYASQTRVRVCENGLWTYTSLRSWDSVEYADWVPGGPREGDGTLRLRLRRRSLLAPSGWSVVPMDAQLLPEVQAALRAHGVTIKATEQSADHPEPVRRRA
jgi:hypothetical protein